MVKYFLPPFTRSRRGTCYSVLLVTHPAQLLLPGNEYSILVGKTPEWEAAASISCPEHKGAVSAVSGGTARLPCNFSPPVGPPAQEAKVAWQKQENEEEVVVHFQNGRENGDFQHRRYHNRTYIQQDWFQLGDVGMELRNVRGGDNGIYVCWVTLLPLRPDSQHRCCEVALTVMAAVVTEPEPVALSPQWNHVIAWIMFIVTVSLLLFLPICWVFSNTCVWTLPPLVQPLMHHRY
eukprot:XP_012809285.1 PREDICTED: uncharacterized protein LOC100489603 isoform X2 [Xenopus tropicalis]